MRKIIDIVKKILSVFIKENPECDCGDIGCKRKIKSTRSGKLYIENHLTCGKVKKFINDYKDVKF